MKCGVCLFVVACTLGAEFSQCQIDVGYGRKSGYVERRPVLKVPSVPRHRREATTLFATTVTQPDCSNNTLYSWRTVRLDNIVVQETASCLNNNHIVIEMSHNQQLEAKNITSSSTIYHDVSGTMIVVIKPSLPELPCILIDTTLTYDKLIEMLKFRNGSDVIISCKDALDATGPILNTDSRAQLFNKSNVAEDQCHTRDVVYARPVAESPANPEANTRDIKVLTFDKVLTFTLPAKASN